MSIVAKTEELTVAFSSDSFKPAIEKCSITIRSGEITLLSGQSGSGKTVLSRAIMSLLPKDARIASGRIEIKEGVRKAIAFQDPDILLSPYIRIGKQIKAVLKRCGFPCSDNDAQSILCSMGLSAEASRLYPFQLSGGMKQRASLSVALAMKPDLLIADEVCSALDKESADTIYALLRNLADQGMAILLVSHDYEAAAYADMCYAMYGGCIIEKGRDAFSSPLHPYTGMLLECRRMPESRKERLRFIEGAMPSVMERDGRCPFLRACREKEEICSTYIPVFDDSAEKASSCIRRRK
ncbi:MAG: oligopeptide/dipeptide ABC transporter ATP-binding protein [Candidatus Ornithospirochaeta sp.]|nr:oligopeptide/dipeptide ABC transporter ATP-binding protein [Candidatus Ornithospirochaeta sp.]